MTYIDFFGLNVQRNQKSFFQGGAKIDFQRKSILALPEIPFLQIFAFDTAKICKERLVEHF